MTLQPKAWVLGAAFAGMFLVAAPVAAPVSSGSGGPKTFKQFFQFVYHEDVPQLHEFCDNAEVTLTWDGGSATGFTGRHGDVMFTLPRTVTSATVEAHYEGYCVPPQEVVFSGDGHTWGDFFVFEMQECP
jgi:hypothetical protein